MDQMASLLGMQRIDRGGGNPRILRALRRRKKQMRGDRRWERKRN